MKKTYRSLALIIITLLALSSTSSFAQLRYKVDYRMLFDNLEASKPYAMDRTNAGILLTPHLGFNMGNHSLIVGAGIQELFGTKKTVDNIDLRAYYEYKDSKFKAIAGIYSVYEREPLPLSYNTTSQLFMNDKAQGFYGKYKNETGYMEAWVDWFKSDVANRVDRFTLAGSGEKWWNDFRLKGIIRYTHFADRPVFEEFNLFDHFQYDLNVGYDFASHQEVFSSILFTVGLSGDMDRPRNDANLGFEPHVGFQTEQLIKWRGFSLHNTFYIGQAQMKYASEYPFIYTGSPFYNDKWNDMLIAKYAYQFKWFGLSACFATFFTPETISTQQLVTITFNIDDVVNFKKKNN